jgi:signal transduction histidine kinase/CheY-like chemotaxis protein
VLIFLIVNNKCGGVIMFGVEQITMEKVHHLDYNYSKGVSNDAFKINSNHTFGTFEILNAGDLSKPGYCFSPEDKVEHIYEILKHNHAITEFSVIDDNTVIGFLTRTEFNEILGGQYGFSLYSKNTIREIMATDFLAVDYYMPIEQVSKLSMQRQFHQLYNPIVVEWEDRYFGIVTVKELLDTSTRMSLAKQEAIIAEMRKTEIAEASNRAKSNFLAKVSHEIRTPMNAIMGITEIQLQEEELPQAIREAFEKIYNSSDLLLGIINDILDLSKIEAGKLVLNPSQYDITKLIHDTVHLNIMRYESKPIEFKLNVNENTPLRMFGDELRIKQILNNILSNAFKYTHEGIVTLSINYINNTLEFIISDTGQGMTPEQVNKLGTEYSRFNMEANRETEGIGLGMNITWNLIQLMNGSLSIESAPGIGSTFTVCLPQQKFGSSIIGKELAENLIHFNLDNSLDVTSIKKKRDFMPYGKVLIVDDVETNLYVAKGLMAPYGLSIETVMSGLEAVEKIKNGCKYDIIFMDHMMPKMDGIETTKIIRSYEYKKPIVALTANAITGQAEMFLQHGFDEFISKPIDIRKLDIVLNKLIRDKYPAEVIENARRQKADMDKKNTVKKQNSLIDSQLMEVFAKDAEKAITIIESLYKNEDNLKNYIINIHSMKSALANIGEYELSQAAKKLEQAGREADFTVITKETPLFLKKLKQIIEKIKPKDNTIEIMITEEDVNFLSEKLSVIKTSCKGFNKKPAKEALSGLKERKWPLPIKEQLGIISEHLLHSDFEEASGIADELSVLI